MRPNVGRKPKPEHVILNHRTTSMWSEYPTVIERDEEDSGGIRGSELKGPPKTLIEGLTPLSQAREKLVLVQASQSPLLLEVTMQS